MQKARLLCLLGMLGVVSLPGCSFSSYFKEGNQLISEGRYQDGLAKLEEAVKREPRSVEYKIGLITQRNFVISKLLALADEALKNDRFIEAKKIYLQVKSIDSANLMALQGIESVAVAERISKHIENAEILLKKGGAVNLNLANEEIRAVLAINPQHKKALLMQSQLAANKKDDSAGERKLAQAYKKKVTLEFMDASIKSIFDVLAQVSGLNFFFDKEVKTDAKASIMAKNIAIEDAIKLLLTTNVLEQKVLNGNSVLIYPNTPQKLKEYKVLGLRTFYITNADVKNVANTIKTLLQTKDMVVDERLGIIMMRDTPEVIRLAEKLITLQDAAESEVMLEVEVLEIKRSRLLELGINWPGQLSLSPLVVGDAPVSLASLKDINANTTAARIGNLTINARSEDLNSNILANPRIRVRNKDKAKIMIGERVPVVNTTSTTTGFVAESVSYVDVGLKLEVEPNIYLDEEVAIKINMEVSNLISSSTSKNGTTTYQIGTRNASTVLRLKDGETQTLAGLISDDDRSNSSKVPGLGQLPIIGYLFRSQKDDKQRSEIILSITPRLMRTVRRPDLVMAEFNSGTEFSVGVDNLSMPEDDVQKSVEEGESNNVEQIGRNDVSATPDLSIKKSPPTVSFKWKAQAQTKVGEIFDAVLHISSDHMLSGLPMMIGFDPGFLEMVEVKEGEFLGQNNVPVMFGKRLDSVQGKLFVLASRQDENVESGGVKGEGVVLSVKFKALKPVNETKIQLMSVDMPPMSAVLLSGPVEQIFRIE